MTYIEVAISNDIIFQLLLASIFIDFITGISRACNERKLNSTTGLNGLLRHGLVVIITGIVYYFSHEMDAEWFSHAFALAFILEYVISVVENWGLSGYKLPQSIAKLLDKLPQPDFSGFNTIHDKNDEDRIYELGKVFKNENNKKGDADKND